MKAMEFEELQKIWDTQKNKPLFVIDEKALHNRIIARKNQAFHITNTTELLLIIVNLISGGVVLGMHFGSGTGFMMYVLAGWMFLTALYTLLNRIKRTRENQRFDRTMLGDLSHALNLATYQVRISQIMRWNVVPIAAFCLLGMWEGGKPVWLTLVVLIFFLLTFFASRWEHGVYKRKKRELELLQNKLREE